MVENGEIRSGQAVAVGAKTFVHAMQIEQHDIRLRLFLRNVITSSNWSGLTHTTGMPVRVA